MLLEHWMGLVWVLHIQQNKGLVVFSSMSRGILVGVLKDP